MSSSATFALPRASVGRDLPMLRVVMPPLNRVNSALAADKPAQEPTSKLVLTDARAAEIAAESARLETAEPAEILAWAAQRFAPKFTMATAFGPEGMILIHMLAEVAPKTPIFNLDTGYQFKETLELREQVKRRYGIAVEMKQPDTTVEQYEQQHGGPLYRTNPDQCCFDPKGKAL